MYGIWWIFIGLTVLTTVSIVWAIFADSYYSENIGQIIAAVIFGLAAIISLGCSIFDPIEAKAQVIEFQYKKEMVEKVIQSGENFENFAISDTVIRLNTWLSEARANKEAYANWSPYRAEDLGSLSPIELP